VLPSSPPSCQTHPVNRQARCPELEELALTSSDLSLPELVGPIASGFCCPTARRAAHGRKRRYTPAHEAACHILIFLFQNVNRSSQINSNFPRDLIYLNLK
jgi:hypothetical protein